MIQKQETFCDLKKALEVMRYIDEKTPKSKVFYAMWLMETRALANGTNIYVSLVMIFVSAPQFNPYF